MSATTYPVRVDASLDAPVSRWLWLVKWLLAIPHYIILGFLWIAFVVLSIVAFFAILATGRYPRPIFDFNVGVLRWTWRVQYYAYGALGTDRYPPFSLEEVADYPAHLAIEYPGRLSRGLVLVKWWLLAIPHYIVVGLFAGGGTFLAWRLGNQHITWAGGGLIGIFVLVAAVILAFTGSYPEAIFDFVLGMNRWVLRVAAYAGLMTDQYPPFRFDLGGHEPGGPVTLRPPGPVTIPPTAGAPAVIPPSAGRPAATPPATGTPGPRGTAGLGWTGGRVVAVVAGSLLALASLGTLAGGAGLLWADLGARSGGFVTSAASTYSTSGRAIATGSISLPGGSWDNLRGSLVGTVRIRVTSSDPARPVFVGIAPAGAVARYLSGVSYTTITSATGSGSADHAGSVVPALPESAGIWHAEVAGTGTQSLAWTAPPGDWTIVVMNQDSSAGLLVRADAGATLPYLRWIAAGVLAFGLLLAGGAVPLLAMPVRRAGRTGSIEPGRQISQPQ